MNIVIYYNKCYVCDREIMIEIVINGTNHNIAVQPTCKECVDLSDEYRARHPDLANEIDEWKASK